MFKWAAGRPTQCFRSRRYKNLVTIKTTQKLCGWTMRDTSTGYDRRLREKAVLTPQGQLAVEANGGDTQGIFIQYNVFGNPRLEITIQGTLQEIAGKVRVVTVKEYTGNEHGPGPVRVRDVVQRDLMDEIRCRGIMGETTMCVRNVVRGKEEFKENMSSSLKTATARYIKNTIKAGRRSIWSGAEFQCIDTMARGDTFADGTLLYYQPYRANPLRPHILILGPPKTLYITLLRAKAYGLDEKFALFENGIITTGLTIINNSRSNFSPAMGRFKHTPYAASCILAFSNERSQRVVNALMECVGFTTPCCEGCQHGLYYDEVDGNKTCFNTKRKLTNL